MNLRTVCLLLGVCHAGTAAALGLGELNVRSSLGQPLNATVRILGATAATEAQCFSLRPSADSAVPPPLRAQLSLERRGDDTILHIRTPAAVTDPIAQFTLVSDCESRLQRDYVVLLDPPSPAALARAETEAPGASAAPVEPARAPAKAATSPRPTLDRANARPARPDTRTARAERPGGRERSAAADPAPRLVLSGRHGVPPGALALRFDTTLPDLDRPRPDALTPDELSDENTALTRKLAHLEAQLQDLSRRNAELETRRGAATSAPPPATELPPRWPLYALLAGLVVAAALLVVLLRRRARAADTSAADAAAADPDSTLRDPWPTHPHSAPRRPADTPGEPVVVRASARNEAVADFEPSGMAQTTEVNDDILDQAEVYMAHGHGDLAIHLLQEHLRAAPDESPVPWLLLLDLLHREGDAAGYAEASAECRRHFNINLGTHGESDTGRGIEAYPHLLDELIKVWGTDEAETFFDDLIFDRRGGTRIGFEPGAYREILLLHAIAQAR